MTHKLVNISLLYLTFTYNTLGTGVLASWKVTKCASLIVPNNNDISSSTESILDIYEGKENIPAIYSDLEEKIKSAKAKIWEASCNVTICGWDGSFGQKCTKLIDGENNLVQDQV